ncbi:hypothetical protein QQZ08_008674 [Neonectria magnoliae]|uniref:Uncharacterized protein n=1 Tax=Neonectria magnoliae TaxID=2732573 RepID=A0ABR1HU91_9HYPO
MDKHATPRPDPSSELLLSSVDAESHESERIALWKKKRRWYNSSLLRSQLITTYVIIALGTTVLVQSILLAQRDPTSVPCTGDAASAPAHTKAANGVTHLSGPSNSTACGTNANEAMALGCIFDYMNFSWQPKECYYPDLDQKHSDLMRKEAPVRWWADANLTMPLPDDADVLKMYEEVWIERRFHYKHCMYSWDLLHYSYDTGKPLPDLMSYKHSLHCAHVLDKAIQKDTGGELLIEHAVTWYSGCVWPKALQ